jgi:hypothetical protein
MRKRYVQIDGQLIEVDRDYAQPRAEVPTVWGDLPGYESPVTGKWIEGRAARREDLARTGCRPYEGRDQEVKEAARHRAYAEQKFEQRLDEAAHRAVNYLSSDARRALFGD